MDRLTWQHTPVVLGPERQQPRPRHRGHGSDQTDGLRGRFHRASHEVSEKQPEA